MTLPSKNNPLPTTRTLWEENRKSRSCPYYGVGGLPWPWAAEPPAIAPTGKISTKTRDQRSQGQGNAAYPIRQLRHGTSQTDKSAKAKKYAITYIGIERKTPANQC